VTRHRLALLGACLATIVCALLVAQPGQARADTSDYPAAMFTQCPEAYHNPPTTPPYREGTPAFTRFMTWCGEVADQKFASCVAGTNNAGNDEAWCHTAARNRDVDLDARYAGMFGKCRQGGWTGDPPFPPGVLRDRFANWCADFYEHCFSNPTGASVDQERACLAEYKRRQAAGEDPNAFGGGRGSGDPSLTGASPLCQDALSGQAKANCDATGTVSRAHPLGNYGLDYWVADDLKSDPVGKLIPSAIQGVSSLVWQVELWVLNAVLLLVEWGFSLNFFAPSSFDGSALPQMKLALIDLHENVLGTWWMLMTFAIAGTGAIWNGLVRMRTIQTLGALLGTVLLIIASMVIIYRPEDTIGRVANVSHDTALSLLGVGSHESGSQALATSSRGVFDGLVRSNWCTLEFADEGACDRYQYDPPPAGGRSVDKAVGNKALGEAWLQFPANGPERESLWKGLKETWHRPDLARLQETGAATERFAMLALILIQVLGGIALFGYQGLRLLSASTRALFLTMLAPVMLAAPALGETGRAAFGKWIRADAGAAVTQFIFSVEIVVTLLVFGWIDDMQGLGWFTRGMVRTAFLWTVFLKRHEIEAPILGEQARGSGMGFLKAYYGYRAARDVAGQAFRVGRGAVRGATFLPRKAAGAGWRATREHRRFSRLGDAEAIRKRAGTALDAEARTDIGRQVADAQAHLRKGAVLDHRLAANRQGMSLVDRKDPSYAKLVKNRARLEKQKSVFLNDPRTKHANATLSRYGDGTNPDAGSLRNWRDTRAREVEAWRNDPSTWDAAGNRRAAGIGDAEYASAVASHRAGSSADLDRLRHRSEAKLDEHRTLLARADASPPSRTHRREAMREYGRTGPKGWRGHRDQEFARRRREERRRARREERERAHNRRRW
jgi:hypothetical protein